MPITIKEQLGRRLGDDSAERIYLVLGTADASNARVALKTYLTNNGLLTLNGLDLAKTTVEELGGIDGGAFTGVARYGGSGGSQPPQVGDTSFSFRTSGGTTHITQAVDNDQTVYDDSGSVVDPFGGAIGVTEHGVEGVDVHSAVYRFSETHYFDPANVDNAYKGTLNRLTGSINDAAFKGLAAGECLLLGAVGERQGDDPWRIDFEFAGSANRTNLTVGEITVAEKLGWDYLWVRYQTIEDTNQKLLVRKPLLAAVARVYDQKDFSQLGIGT